MLENLMNDSVPKCENRMSGDNQQEKYLSYVIGVYFGDGYTGLNHGGIKARFFRLEVIDKDFRDFAAQSCDIAFPDYHTTRFEHIKSEKKYYGLQVRGIGTYLETVTGKRRFIPNFVYTNDDNKRMFVEGMMDSEAWISINVSKSGNTIHGRFGFAITSEIIHELARLLSQLNVKYGKISTFTKNRKKPLKTITLHIPSFLDAGLKFHIERKQSKLEKFKMIREIVGSTYKERCSFREQNPGLIKRMVCSELHGDMKKLAEMTSSVQ
uniref:DOD-type homing endonuclease domain-containing protein n=1 Tax=viral metagenome TaxID=1070528 RepID=A0A6M3XMJ7_9ZZZZ